MAVAVRSLTRSVAGMARSRPQSRRHFATVAFQQEAPAGVKVKLDQKLPLDKGVWIWDRSANGGKGEPKAVKLGDIIGGKKAVVFGLPGAYTSVCSSKHVPEYASKANELKQKGAEIIVCASVNDPFVMDHWAKDLKVDPETVMMVADPDCSFHKSVGLNQTLPPLGERAYRYSMFVNNDGTIKVLNIEEPGGQSYKTSGPSHMLQDLEKLPSDLTQTYNKTP